VPIFLIIFFSSNQCTDCHNRTTTYVISAILKQYSLITDMIIVSFRNTIQTISLVHFVNLEQMHRPPLLCFIID